MVLMAGAIGTVVSLAMIKNILFFQKYVRSAEEDLTVVQTTQEIVSILTSPPSCLYDATPCTYNTSCTNTLGDSDFEDKTTGAPPEANTESLDSLYGHSVGSAVKSKKFLSESDPDFSTPESTVNGITIKSIEVHSGLSADADRDGKIKVKITLKTPGDGETSYKTSRVFDIPVFVKEYRSADSTNPDYYKIKECSFYSAQAGKAAEGSCEGQSGQAHSYGGGFIANTASVANTAFIGRYASVCDTARVEGNARVTGKSTVYEQAHLSGDANISGEVLIYGQARIYGDTRVYEYADVSGNTEIYGSSKVYGNARVYGDAKVYGQAQIYDAAKIYGTAELYDNAEIYDAAKVYGNAKIYGDAKVYERAKIYGTAVQVYENAEVYGDVKVYDQAQIYGGVKAYENAKVYDNAEVYGICCKSMEMLKLYADAKVSGIYSWIWSNL